MTSITEIRNMYNEGMNWNSLICGNHFVIEYQPDRDLAIITYLYVSGYMIQSPESVTYFCEHENIYPFERFIADVKEFKTCKSQN